MGCVSPAQSAGVGTLTVDRTATAGVGAATGWKTGATAGPDVTKGIITAGAGAGASAWQGNEGSSAHTAVQLPNEMALRVVTSTTVQPPQTANWVEVRLSVTQSLLRMAAVRLLTKLPSRL